MKLTDMMAKVKTQKIGDEWQAVNKETGAIIFREVAPLGRFLDDLYRHLKPSLFQAGGTPYSALIGR
jgi:hypothetical protein